jgi:hypothetical protein
VAVVGEEEEEGVHSQHKGVRLDGTGGTVLVLALALDRGEYEQLVASAGQ